MYFFVQFPRLFVSLSSSETYDTVGLWLRIRGRAAETEVMDDKTVDTDDKSQFYEQ